MTSKITLANGTVIEYDGEVLIDKDGSMIFSGGKQSVAASIENSADESKIDSSVDTIIDTLLGDIELNDDINVQMIDAMLNITQPHFDVFQVMAERTDAVTWSTKSMARETGLSESAALSRLCNLVFSRLIYRPKRGVYRVRAEASAEYTTERDRIIAERRRRYTYRNPYVNADAIEDDQESE